MKKLLLFLVALIFVTQNVWTQNIQKNEKKILVHEQISDNTFSNDNNGGLPDNYGSPGFDNPNYYYAAIKTAPSGVWYRQAGLSPDGTKIVAGKQYTDGSFTRREVVLMNADGSGEILISPGNSGEGDIYQYGNPFWSDDGSVIGYVEAHNANPNKVVTYTLATSSLSYIYSPTASDVCNADFMGNSITTIVFWDWISADGAADLFIWDGTTLTNITNSPLYSEYEPCSNNTGTAILYWSGETTTEPIDHTHTLTNIGGIWTKDVGFTPIPYTYWSYWTNRPDNYIGVTVLDGTVGYNGTMDVHLYDNTGTFVADMTGPGYIGGVGQWNFVGTGFEGPNGEILMGTNAGRGAAPGRDIVMAVPRNNLYVNAASGSDLYPGTVNAPFATVQKAVAEAVANGTVYIYPGVYNTGAFVYADKPGLDILGVDGSGNPITSAANVLATVGPLTGGEADMVFHVVANDVTISGIRIADLNNKAMTINGDNFTLTNCRFENQWDLSGSIYFYDATPGIKSPTNPSVQKTFTITGNVIKGWGIAITDGTGCGWPASGRVISGNTFGVSSLYPGYTFYSIGFRSVNGSGWCNSPVGGATITGNDFADMGSRGYVWFDGLVPAEGLDFGDILDNNTFALGAVMAFDPTGAARPQLPTDPLYNPVTRPNLVVLKNEIGNEIAKAQDGDVVQVAAGTYNEQLYINKSIDLLGAGSNLVKIEAPDIVDRTTYSITQWNGSVRTIDAVIGVNEAGTVNITGLTVDGRDLGPDNFYGIHFFNTDGSVTNCVIDNITDAIQPSNSRVVSLSATHGLGETFSVDFSNNVIPVFQKGGIAIMGPGAAFTVNENQVTNIPSPALAGNGIQLSYGATGSTLNNVVDGVAYIGADWAATGILLFESGDITMDGDEVKNCQSGVNFSDWGWVYLNPNPVTLDFANLNLHDNEWTLGVQMSRDNSDVHLILTDSEILNSGGDGIDVWGTGPDPWGGTYYTGWNHGNLDVDITGSTITNSFYDGIWLADLSGNTANNIHAIDVHECYFDGNSGFAINNALGLPAVQAQNNWWGDPSGPNVVTKKSGDLKIAGAISIPYGEDIPELIPEITKQANENKGSGEDITGFMEFDPWYIDEPMTQLSESDIDIGIFETGCGEFAVKLKVYTNYSSLTNVQFTLKWPEALSLTDFVYNYPITTGAPITPAGGYKYETYLGFDWQGLTWSAGSEYTLMTFSHDQAGTGTGNFLIMPDTDPKANPSTVYYAEAISGDVTGEIYANALGVDLGKCPLYIIGTFTANDKIYDGNTDATFLTNNLVLDDVKVGDLVTLTGIEIDFNTKDVGTDKLVSITAASITGADASKYQLFLTPAPTALADITPKTLTASVIGDPTKPYDGNTTATLASSNYSIAGLVLSETITITETVGNYASANAGIHLISVTLDNPGDFTAGPGTLLTNYTLPATATGNGTITAIPLTVTAVNKTKVYDGAVFPYGSYTASYSGFIPGEDETDLSGALVFTGPAITATAVGIYTISPGGYSSINYTISYVNGQLTITPVTLGLKVLLQGPYAGGSLMNTGLTGQIPSAQPYYTTPWSYLGSESELTPPATTVDWVLVELRTGEGAGTKIGRCAALLNNNGTIAVTINDVTFPGVHSGESYYIVVWHRNHMPVMSASAITVPVTSYDFTVLGNLYGFANPVPNVPAIDLGSDVYGMIACDVTKNGVLRYSGPGNDRGAIIAKITALGGTTLNSVITGGYWYEDANMNNQLSYLGGDNDRQKIITNLSTLTGNSYLNSTYTSVVPGAVTGGKDGSNDGSVDIQFVESAESLTIDLMTKEMIESGIVDNIQFTLAWKANDTEIEELLTAYSSSFQLQPQGNPTEVDGNNYLVFASVTPTNLPEVWDIDEQVTALSFAKENGQLISSRLWIADDDFTSSSNGEFYVSNWGTDVTGMIQNVTTSVSELTQNNAVRIYPNPVSGNAVNMELNLTKDQEVTLSVLDVNGKIISSETISVNAGISFNRIDLNNLNQGIYFIKVLGDKLNTIEKLVIK